MPRPSSQTILSHFCDIAFPMLNQRQIAELRKRMGLSQSEMASALGIANRLTVSKWETGTSAPGGPVMRFLSLLNSLSDTELRRIIRQLEAITQEDGAKN